MYYVVHLFFLLKRTIFLASYLNRIVHQKLAFMFLEILISCFELFIDIFILIT
jgi:hypothetical protein